MPSYSCLRGGMCDFGLLVRVGRVLAQLPEEAAHYIIWYPPAMEATKPARTLSFSRLPTEAGEFARFALDSAPGEGYLRRRQQNAGTGLFWRQ